MTELKPCPFCGNKKFDVTREKIFYELQGETGSASVRLTCWDCQTDMWEHTWAEKDYYKRVELLVKKWNRRADDAEQSR